MPERRPTNLNSIRPGMPTDEDGRFCYEFSIWPDEKWGFDPAVYELFRMTGRFEVRMTRAEFERFRSGLSHHGLTLREVTRVQYLEPENVL